MKAGLTEWVNTLKSKVVKSVRRIQWIRIPAMGFKAKAWSNGFTVVKIRLVAGSAQAYYTKRGDNTRHILTNGPCSIKDAEFIAKMYMYHGIRVSSCPLRVETEDGVKFRSIPLSRLRRFVQQHDKGVEEAYREFIGIASNGSLPESN